jgi:hypothetical protein
MTRIEHQCLHCLERWFSMLGPSKKSMPYKVSKSSNGLNIHGLSRQSSTKRILNSQKGKK